MTAGSPGSLTSIAPSARRHWIMGNALHMLVGFDQDAVRATTALRWSPATVVLTLASAWWVKGPLLVGVGWCADLRKRRLLPLIAGTATASFALASWLNAVLKAVVDRSRPPHAIGLDAIGSVPVSPSFPSGHAMSAFAVASAIAVLSPRLRWPVLAVAGVIAFSRVYLGVHFWLDVLVGAVLGIAIGAGMALGARRLARPRAG
jgi:membrane-associated phospholipid phosphatase